LSCSVTDEQQPSNGRASRWLPYIAAPAHPRVVSNTRLAVDLTANRAELANDPGASSLVQGYASHYCAVPRRDDPGIVACSFILSGLRVCRSPGRCPLEWDDRFADEGLMLEI